MVLSCIPKILTLHCSSKMEKGFYFAKNHSLNLPVGRAAGIEIQHTLYQLTSVNFRKSLGYLQIGQPILMKVSKKAKIRNRYDQVPHLTQDTIWESG